MQKLLHFFRQHGILYNVNTLKAQQSE